MSWFKVDDKLRSHPKWIAITRDARDLWFDAGMWCSAHNNDGVVPADAIPMIAASAKLTTAQATKAIAELVRVRLWKVRPKSKGAGWEFHDWVDYQPLKQQVQKKAEQQRKHDWLHKTRPGRAVKALIERRDGKWCRYCGIEFTEGRGDRRSMQRKTFDFVDPAFVPQMVDPTREQIEDAADAIVLACGFCNAAKGDRTPQDADLVLLPAPGDQRNHSRSAREQIAAASGTTREVGTGRNGAEQIGTDLGGSYLVETGLIGSALDAAGDAEGVAAHLTEVSS